MIQWMPRFKARLVVVDDEPSVVEIITMMLSGQGYDIRKAYDGDEAVSIANGFRPNCVVTGVMMPRMGGFQEAIAILQFLPNCKFVFVSGSAHHPAVREEYARFGWDLRLLLQKPFERLDLLNALALTVSPECGLNEQTDVPPTTT